MTDDLEQRTQAQRETTAAGAAAQAATQVATNKLEERIENPEFFDQLRDVDLDTGEYPWIEQRLGPLTSGAHLIANRSQEYERETRFLDQNRAERMVAEGEPGRLCRGRILSIAQRVHGRTDKSRTDPNTMDERRVIRDAMEAVTNFKSLGIETAGLSSVTDATAVSKVEKSEQESKSRRERASEFLG